MGASQTMKKFEIRDLSQTIKSLDGRPEVAKDGNGKELGLIVKPFDFTGKALYALAKTQTMLEPAMAAMQKAQRDIVKKYYPNDDAPKDGKYMSACNEELQEMFLSEDTVEVHRVNISELKVQDNKLPPAVIAALMPMLEGEIV